MGGDSFRFRADTGKLPGQWEKEAFFLTEQHQYNAVDHRRQGAEDDDGSRDLEHLGGHAGDEALWLCQDRHTLFSKKLRQPTFQWAAFASGYCLD